MTGLWRSRALAAAQLLAGVALAGFGLLLVLDYLSLRELLQEGGPRTAWRAATALHAILAHPGAQVVEFILALVGLTIVARSLRHLLLSAS